VLVVSGWLLLHSAGGALRLGRLTTADQLDIVKIALSVVAGVGGVIALTVAYRKQQLGEAAEARAEAAHRREDTKAFTERFGACVEQLGSEQPAVRLGGVYALTHLADDWEAGRQTCIDVLCAYLRMPYAPDQPDNPDAHAAFLAFREVRHTIWRLIGNHLRADATEVSWCGHDFDFTGAIIDGAGFQDAVFSGGRVSFNSAEFSGGRVDFGHAKFSGGRVDFGGAKFSGALVAFGGAEFLGDEFFGGQVSFGGAEFSGGQVDFSHAKFSGGQVSFNGAKFSGGQVDFLFAEFSGGRVSFNGAAFSGGHVDLSHPRDYSEPPGFGSWTTPPAGLLLPTTVSH
jgi:uncharacterized protein YjbI with pentapeptide repeats